MRSSCRITAFPLSSRGRGLGSGLGSGAPSSSLSTKGFNDAERER